MGRRSKQLVRNRSKPHIKRARDTKRKRIRARSRGFHPSRRRKSARRKKR